MDLARWHIWADRSGRGGGSGRVTEPPAPLFRWPAVLGEEPVRLAEDHWRVQGLAPAWPMGSPGSRENAADIGYRFGLTRRAAGRACLVCGWAAECNDQPRINLLPAGRCAPVSAGLLLIWHVPAVDLSCPSRDGTDDGERSKRTRDLRSPDDAAGAAKASSTPR